MARNPLTASVSNQLIATTGPEESGIALIIPTTGSGGAATLGGGTLSLTCKPVGGDPNGTPVTLDTGIPLGSANNYYGGVGMAYYITLAGATSPILDVIASNVR